MKVIDISAWQEDVDWQAIVDAGIDGVIIKIGELEHLDDMFIDHVNSAIFYGLKYGVYYYSHAYNYETAYNEAEIVASWLEEYLRGETPELGIWYDAEDDDMLQGDVTEVCMTFLNRLTDYNHQYQGIYSSWDWLSAEGSHYIHIEDLPDYVPYWVANYSEGNTFDTAGRDYLKEEYPYNIIRIHQFTDNLEGFGYDANIYYTEQCYINNQLIVIIMDAF